MSVLHCVAICNLRTICSCALHDWRACLGTSIFLIIARQLPKPGGPLQPVSGPPTSAADSILCGVASARGLPAMLRLTTGVCLIPTKAPGSTLWPSLLA